MLKVISESSQFIEDAPCETVSRQGEQTRTLIARTSNETGFPISYFIISDVNTVTTLKRADTDCAETSSTSQTYCFESNGTGEVSKWIPVVAIEEAGATTKVAQLLEEKLGDKFVKLP
tara:strand:- start:1670 stop:2023 length:354 start_codon:yes stop_codon:yes gene_type:complete